MGQSFTQPTNQLSKIQYAWVPRESDINGGGDQGGSLVMLTYGESVLFDALAITDTATHLSLPPAGDNPVAPFDQVYAAHKTGVFTSTLNQAVALQPVWSRDRSAWYAFSSAVSIPAYFGTGAPQSMVVALSTPSLYLPYVGVQATCATAPTSGVLMGWLERLG